MTRQNTKDLLAMAADLTAAYVSHNSVAADALPALIQTVFKTLEDIANANSADDVQAKPVPAIPVDQSVTDDFIFSLEDGQPYKSLKRHLKAKYGMSPEDYKEKWDLPIDYPMVAPAYGRERSNLAKKSGLGRNRGV